MFSNELLFFSSFILFILFFLILDLGVFNRKAHVVGYKEAIFWSVLWIGLSLGFYGFVLFHGDLIHGPQNIGDINFLIEKYGHPISVTGLDFPAALEVYRSNLGLEYLTGYLIEKALSVDNIFVIILIFYSFSVEPKYYHKILFWGILGALIMRMLFIFISGALIQEYAWILYIFGGFLIFTGLRMLFSKDADEKIDTHKHPVVRFVSKYLSVYPRNLGGNFFIYRGKFFITPLFIVLLVVEFSDLIFAVDSIPAIFAITKDPYIVFFSNIFAILGLRALFFLLINVMNKFHYLKTGLAILLAVIGIKMLIHDILKEIGFTTSHSLLLIVLILGVSIVASLVFPKKETV